MVNIIHFQTLKNVLFYNNRYIFMIQSEKTVAHIMIEATWLD
jgi:hypothetical protein